MNKICFVLFVMAVFFTTACTPFTSKNYDGKSPIQGVVYKLPKKDIVVTISESLVDGKCEPEILLKPTAVYGDPEYILTAAINVNQFGSNTSDITVSETGLLQTATSNATSGVQDIINGLANSLAVIKGPSAMLGPSSMASLTSSDHDTSGESNPCMEGQRQWVIDGNFDEDELGNQHVQIQEYNSNLVDKFWNIELLSSDYTLLVHSLGGSMTNGDGNTQEILKRVSNGMAYRISSPYLVQVVRTDEAKRIEVAEAAKATVDSKIKGTKRASEQDADSTKKIRSGAIYKSIVRHQEVLNLPDTSRVFVVKTPRSVFGNKNTTLTFKDGMLTKYDADFSGDALATVSLPFNVISALSKAVGSALTIENTDATNEIEYLQKIQELELARIKNELCLAAVRERDPAKVREACE